MADNREYEEGTIYEAGVGIYFSDGEDHTNINVEDEVLAQINQNTEDIEALDTRMTTAEGNISALDGRLTTAEGDIDNLEGRMTTAEGDIDALEGRMNTAEGDITTLQGRMTTAEGDIDSLEGRMTTAESDIDALEGRMTTAEGNITSQGTRLTTAEGNITTLQGDVSGLGTRMTTAEGDIDALEGRMTTAEGDIDAVELRVTAIENDPTTVDVGTTTTGAEGTQASVTNSGTTHNAVFNFTIPKGDTGATGATGPQGPTGPAGPGVAAGGTSGQVLSKVDGTDYNTQWINAPTGGIEWEDKDPTTFAIADLPAKDVFYHFPAVTYSTASALYQNIIPLISSASKTYECFMHGIYIKDTSTKRIFMFDILFSPNIPDASNKVEGLRMIGGNSFDSSTGSVSNPTTYKMCTPFCGFNLQRLDYNTSSSAITIGTISGTNDSNKSVANILMKNGGEILLSIFFVVNSSAYVNTYVNMKWIGSYYLYGEVTCVVNNVLYKLKVKVSDYRSMTDSTKWTVTVSTV